jgi:fatty acid desaturase
MSNINRSISQSNHEVALAASWIDSLRFVDRSFTVIILSVHIFFLLVNLIMLIIFFTHFNLRHSKIFQLATITYLLCMVNKRALKILSKKHFKSSNFNWISFFRLLSWVMSAHLRHHVTIMCDIYCLVSLQFISN